MNPDLEDAMDMLYALKVNTTDEVLALVVPGDPWSKSRPRFTRVGKTYTEPKDVAAQKVMRSHLSRGIPEGTVVFDGNVALGCIFYRSNRQRIDTDNLLKHVCDAATGILWADDCQATAVLGAVELDVENPRTVIVAAKHVSTLTRGKDHHYPCAVCGEPIWPIERGHAPKTCSRECSTRYKQYSPLNVRVPCSECGALFRRVTKTQTLCSNACRVVMMTDRVKTNARPLSRCSDCDVELAHWRGGRCRTCWKVSLRSATGGAS